VSLKKAQVLATIALVVAVLVLAGCRAAPKAPSPPTPQASPQPTPATTTASQCPLSPPPALGEDRPLFSTFDWKTDFSKHNVPYSEIISGGVGKDGIPPIYAPKFESVHMADTWLTDSDPVAFLQIGEQAHAYPLRILIWHEIVNDQFADVPLVVTYCPLCNTAVVFDARLPGKAYTFGVSGLLRNSDLIMWDHETESLWQQGTGEAIVGGLTGQMLTFLPSSIVAWRDFKTSFPGGEVLSQNTGYSRGYGINPYVGYDSSSSPFLFTGKLDPRLAALERVIGITIEGKSVAYPFSVLAKLGVVDDKVGGKQIVVFYSPGTVSPLDKPDIETSREVGSAAVFYAVLKGKTLTFEWNEGRIVDRETSSTWNIFGKATEGPLKGQKLEPVVHGTHFWFAWAAFNSDTIIYEP
ncbi:MAG: DUF3179 domain-containing protein, partial [Chloroflexi bacterium]|nr:DUF3179 domain-containing protein [Chloroflexota bacterium]